jgi:acetyl esterase
MALDPQVATLLSLVERGNRPALHRLSPAQARQAYEKSAPILDVAPVSLPRVEDLHIPVGGGATIVARLYLPREPSWIEPLPALLYFHGGGFTVGSIATHDALARMFAARADCAVLSVDYRLAPEYRFPTAADDAWTAARWLFDNAAALGLDAQRIAFGGDSAGGTLATVCAVLARHAGLRPVLQLLIYPGLSAHQDTASHRRLANGYLLAGETIQWFFGLYVRDAADREDWRFAPLDGARGAPSFDHLAPAFIAAAEYDPLVDENVAYADKLRRAGNEVTLRVYEGMIHEFFKLGGYVRKVRLAHADAVDALRRAFGAAVRTDSPEGVARPPC